MERPESCPKDGNTECIIVEYGYGSPERYDGVSEFLFRPCGHRYGRWTGMPLPRGFIEPRLGRGGIPIPAPQKEDDDVIV